MVIFFWGNDVIPGRLAHGAQGQSCLCGGAQDRHLAATVAQRAQEPGRHTCAQHTYMHYIYIHTEGVLMGGAGVQIVETRIFWEVLWWKHLHMKNIQKNSGKTNQTHVPCQASPQTLPWIWTFCFFGFLEVLAKLQKTMEKPKAKKNKMKPTNPNAHTYVNGTDVKTHGYAVTHNTFLQ